jgi:hypothetical protein
MSSSDILKSLLRPLLRKEDYDRIFAKSLTRDRVRLIVTAGLARVFGRRALCYQCGERLPKVLAFMRRGQLTVWGLQQDYVRVQFADRQTLQFSHVLPEACVRKDVEIKDK